MNRSQLYYEYYPAQEREDPYELYEKMRRCGAIHWNDKYQSWFVTGYAAAQALLKDPRASSATVEAFYYGTFPVKERNKIKPILELFTSWIIFSDPPYHTALRKVMSDYFSSANINRLKTKIFNQVELMLEQDAEFDLMEKIARPLPLLIICEFLGLNKQDTHLFQEWNAAIAKFLNSVYITPEIYQPALTAVAAEQHYFNHYVDELLTRKESNIIVDLYRTLQQENFFNKDHFWMLLSMLLGTGSETTVNLIGNSVLALLQHPQVLKHMRQNISDIPKVVEETLRFYPPVHAVMRFAKEDIDIHDVQIKKGQYIRIFLAAANRDPEFFKHPEQFDLMRDDAKHLSFGYGIHYCLGHLLSRLTATLFLEQFIKKNSNLQLATHSLEWSSGGMMRGLKSLRLLRL